MVVCSLATTHQLSTDTLEPRSNKQHLLVTIRVTGLLEPIPAGTHPGRVACPSQHLLTRARAQHDTQWHSRVGGKGRFVGGACSASSKPTRRQHANKQTHGQRDLSRLPLMEAVQLQNNLKLTSTTSLRLRNILGGFLITLSGFDHREHQ